MTHFFLLQKSQLENRCPKNITYSSFMYMIRFLNVGQPSLQKAYMIAFDA